MSYTRKTTDEFQIIDGSGEEVTAETTRKAARENLRLYRQESPENGPYSLKVVRVPIKTEEPAPGTPGAKVWTLAEVKAANRAAGKHHFDRKTTQCFKSQYHRHVYQGIGGIFVVDATTQEFSNGHRSTTHNVRQFFPTDTEHGREAGDVRQIQGNIPHKEDAMLLAAKLAKAPGSFDIINNGFAPDAHGANVEAQEALRAASAAARRYFQGLR